jgi:DNA-binding NarL/FixJ family response regulator
MSHSQIKMTRTLIVDDSDTFRQTLRNLLGSRFHLMTFSEARDGKEALQLVDAYHPDLIFMDIKLPGENGLAITKKIRSSHCQAIIIIFTSHDLPEYRHAASVNGANYFMSKGSSTIEGVFALVESIVSELAQAKMAETDRTQLKEFHELSMA